MRSARISVRLWQWITVTATVKVEFQMAYKKKGPVLYVEKVEPAEPPVEEMVYF